MFVLCSVVSSVCVSMCVVLVVVICVVFVYVEVDRSHQVTCCIRVVLWTHINVAEVHDAQPVGLPLEQTAVQPSVMFFSDEKWLAIKISDIPFTLHLSHVSSAPRLTLF